MRKVPSAESIFFECKVISFLLTKYVKTSQNSLFVEKSVTTVKVSFQDTIEGETVFSRHDLFSLQHIRVTLARVTLCIGFISPQESLDG